VRRHALLSVNRDRALGLGQVRGQRINALAEFDAVLVSRREQMENKPDGAGTNHQNLIHCLH
jgi:hypothetical protein